MTVITKPIVEKKDQKALLDENDKVPEVTVTQPKESRKTVAKKKATKKQSSGDDVCSTIFTFLIVAGIIAGLSYFALYVYKNKWMQRRARPWMETQMQRNDASEIESEPVIYGISWINAYILFDGQSLILGRFDDLNEIKKTSKEMDTQILTEVKTHELATYFQIADMTEIKFEYSEEMETLEMLQMPELSKGRYIHDFMKKKTLIVDSDNDRCFITDLDENEIQKPRNMCQMLNGIGKGGVYKMDLEEVRKETYAIEIENVDSTVYGCPIATISRNNCNKFYHLYDIHDELLKEMLDEENVQGLDDPETRVKRSSDGANKEFDFVEFAGKSLVKYNIVNIIDLSGEK